jgi:hypothetical protein
MGTKIAALLLAFGLPAFAATDANLEAWLKPAAVSFEDAKAGLEKAHKSGQDVMKAMVGAYEASTDIRQKAWIAQLFYSLGIESAEAKRVLMKDIRTDDQQLRLQVQWAVGRVSADDDVVTTLLDNMMHDRNPLFRDKAACALASDQIHLKPAQKAKLYSGLIQALGSEVPQVRAIAIQALQIQTGQNKGFNPNASPEERQVKIEVWRKWLAELKANL